MFKVDQPVVVFDLETTGTWIEKDKIIEIGMIKCLPGGKKETYHQLINPGMEIPPIVSEITGIKNEDVQGKASFRQLAAEIYDFVQNCDFGGFNVERFDLPILERELHEAGLKLEWRESVCFDAQRVYHLNEKRDLTAAYNFYCSKDLSNAHSAMADAQATLEILEMQVKKYGEGSDKLESLKTFEYKKIDHRFDREGKFCWWNGELYLTFGKYARRNSLAELVKKDSGYLRWMLGSEFSEEIKNVIENALEGRMPDPPKDRD